MTVMKLADKALNGHFEDPKMWYHWHIPVSLVWVAFAVWGIGVHANP